MLTRYRLLLVKHRENFTSMPILRQVFHKFMWFPCIASCLMTISWAYSCVVNRGRRHRTHPSLCLSIALSLLRRSNRKRPLNRITIASQISAPTQHEGFPYCSRILHAADTDNPSVITRRVFHNDTFHQLMLLIKWLLLHTK
jgi:hypothetical protein